MTKNSGHLIQNLRILWRKHIKSIWRDIQWPLVITLVIIAFVLGYIGLDKYFKAQGLTNSPLDNLYATIQLFMLSTPFKTGPVPIELELARFLALIVTLGTTLTALVIILHEQIQFLQLKLIRDHTIICGLGNKGAHLVNKLNESGEQVIVIERDESNDLIKTCEDQGVTVLKGDAKDKELLIKAGVHKAKYIVSFCGDESTNIQVAILSREIAIECKDRVLTCIVNIVNPQVCQVLASLEIEMEKSDCFKIEFFNIFDIGVQSLLKKYPPYADVQKPPHMLVVGLGHAGENIIIQTARKWQPGYNEKRDRLHITIVDKDVEVKKQSLCSRYPQLEKVCEFSIVEVDINYEFYKSQLLLNPELTSDITSAYVCLDQDYLGLSVALLLCKQLRSKKVPIILQTDQDSGLATLLSVEKFENLHIFGLLDWACRPELVLGGIWEVLARANHEEYLIHQKKLGVNPEKNPSMVTWEELPVGLKESNRLQADHIGVKLKAIGCGIAPLTDWDAGSFEFSREEKELMAEMEHERWVKERLRDGWKFGPKKDIEEKISPHLIPWKQLSDEIKEYDRVFIRKLPAFLAQTGFQIYRLN